MRVLIPNSKGNPLIQIDEAEFVTFLREIADKAGFQDRRLCTVQFQFTNGNEISPDLYTGLPKRLLLMVSNIPGTRDQ